MGSGANWEPRIQELAAERWSTGVMVGWSRGVMERKNENRGYQRLRVWQDAITL